MYYIHIVYASGKLNNMCYGRQRITIELWEDIELVYRARVWISINIFEIQGLVSFMKVPKIHFPLLRVIPQWSFHMSSSLIKGRKGGEREKRVFGRWSRHTCTFVSNSKDAFKQLTLYNVKRTTDNRPSQTSFHMTSLFRCHIYRLYCDVSCGHVSLV
jgi:hypothetical protein